MRCEYLNALWLDPTGSRPTSHATMYRDDRWKLVVYHSHGLGELYDQRQAVEAYQGGFISLGRLAEALGLHVLEARAWLAEHQIPQNVGFLQDELAEA